MNNTYGTSNLQQQQQQHTNLQTQHQAQAQSIAYLPAQHMQSPLHEDLTGSTTYFDARVLEKTLSNYVGAAANRYFTTAAPSLSNLPAPHNTILITNNFAQQALPSLAAQTLTGNNNMRFLTNTNNTAAGCGIFNLRKEATTDAATEVHMPHAHLYQHHQAQLPQHQTLAQFATQLPNLQQQQLQHYANLAVQQQQQQHINHATMHLPQYFMHATEAVANAENNKPLPALMATADTLSCTTATTTTPTASITTTPNNATVVLDRINICINNHYTDANNSVNNTSNTNIDAPLSALTCTTTAEAATIVTDELPAQQPSPVIPAIQHKMPLFTNTADALLNESSINNNNNNDNNICINVIDEPDSTTTTSHTPPTTPNIATTEQVNGTNSPIHQSPSTTTTSYMHEITDIFACETPVEEAQQEETAASADILNDANKATDSNTITTSTSPQTIVIDSEDNKEEEETEKNVEENDKNEIITEQQQAQKQAELTAFKIGEDVLLRRQDNRFYLGTVINCAQQRYLVRFDDKSEEWSVPEEMRKLGGGMDSAADSKSEQQSSTGKSTQQREQSGTVTRTQMCVACKRRQPNDVVECCERCGRGYHRGCTSEVLPGSGNYLCKRCAKPMKLQNINEQQRQDTASKVCRQLPYHVDTLNWDEKHRVNEEQIYCYCGKTGKFDHNMLQCCKCRNWFHTQCMQNFKSKLFRGDCFFIFCCAVCNDGKEFLRRLQIGWVDVLHLTLYNLSAMKKHQHHKYHHLLKDIWPFLLENRHNMPIRREWRELSETAFMERVKRTLRENTDRFICGREIKRDHYYYALRHNGPPISPNITVASEIVLSDDFLKHDLQLTLLPDAPENALYRDKENKVQLKRKEDVYEFRIEDDEKFTSDDDVPIKLILEEARRNKTAKLTNNTVKSNQTELNESTVIEKTEEEQTNSVSIKTVNEHIGSAALIEDAQKLNTSRSSRKRKAFSLSKSYKETAVDPVNKQFCGDDSSSDENSSSSRSTSLDIIIPPPKNFNGPNHPFLMVTPKKNAAGGANCSTSIIRRSIVNTSITDFSSRFAALKSAGIFSNLRTCHLAKAAGQPRTVRTIKRKLSAKDIMIGPNQEIRRRRTRRVHANVEVISTTTINPIPCNLYPLHAKELFPFSAAPKAQNTTSSSTTQAISRTSLDSTETVITEQPARPAHGRLLRQRPQKQSPNNSRRGSMSSGSSSSNQSLTSGSRRNSNTALQPPTVQTEIIMQDLKQSVNKYFGAVNRIENGEKYCVSAKRRLPNGHWQYLIEWSSENGTSG